MASNSNKVGHCWGGGGEQKQPCARLPPRVTVMSHCCRQPDVAKYWGLGESPANECGICPVTQSWVSAPLSTLAFRVGLGTAL